MSFTAMKVLKFAVTGAVGLGTGKIVGRIIKTHAAPENIIEKVTITAASWAISGVATKTTKTYTDEIIDSVYEGIHGIVSRIQLKQKLDRINRKESTWEEEGLNVDEFHYNDKTQLWTHIENYTPPVETTVEDKTDASEKKPAETKRQTKTTTSTDK